MTISTATKRANPRAGAQPAVAKVDQAVLAQKISDEGKFKILALGHGSNSDELKLCVGRRHLRCSARDSQAHTSAAA